MSAESGLVQPGATPLITELRDLPHFSGIITIGRRAVYRVPTQVESAVMAVELGGTRAQILYDPVASDNAQARQVMQALRDELTSEQYRLDGDLQVAGNLLRMLANEHARLRGNDSNGKAGN